MISHPEKFISRPVASRLPIALKKAIPHLDMKNGPWVAGGAARRLAHPIETNINGDIDFYFSSQDQFDRFVDSGPFKISRSGMKTITAMEGNDRIQLVGTRFYSSLEHVLSDMDFTICMYGTDGKDLVTTQQADDDHTDRLIRLNHTFRSYRSYRLVKYMLLGFTPVPGAMENMIGSIYNRHKEIDVDAHSY